jgi:hypothetical protein
LYFYLIFYILSFDISGYGSPQGQREKLQGVGKREREKGNFHMFSARM